RGSPATGCTCCGPVPMVAAPWSVCCAGSPTRQNPSDRRQNFDFLTISVTVTRPRDSIRAMSLLEALRRRALKAIWPGLSLLTIVYFGYHAVHGERGLVRAAQLGAEIERAKVAAVDAALERELMESRVNNLR